MENKGKKKSVKKKFMFFQNFSFPQACFACFFS